MWPHKKGLGIRCSYGVDGNGMVLVRQQSDHEEADEDEEDEVNKLTFVPQLEFPRKHDGGLLLQQVESSHQVLLSSQTSRFSLNSKIYNDLQTTLQQNKKSSLKTAAVSTSVTGVKKTNAKRGGAFVPSDILDSYMIESKTLTSAIAYDPTFGSVFATFRFGASAVKKRVIDADTESPENVIVYVSGDSGTVLNISLLRHNNVDGLDEREIPVRLTIPALVKPMQVELSSPIKQILTFNVSTTASQEYIVVRTSAKVHIITCSASRKSFLPFDISVCGEIVASQLQGHDFADVVSNRLDPYILSIIDVKGNFGLWKISRHVVAKKITKMKIESVVGLNGQDSQTTTPSISDSTELSNWKRIVWCDRSHLLAFSRTAIVQFTLSGLAMTSTLLTSANTWSRIQDVQTIGESCFLLTSKELIWCSLAPKFERLISWKHFLDDSDPTLKLHVCEVQKSTFIVSVYSQMHPIIVLYNFGMVDDRPCSLRDPYYHRKQSEGDLQQLTLFPLSGFFPRRTISRKKSGTPTELEAEEDDESGNTHLYWMFETTTSLSLSLNLYSERSLSMVKQSVTPDGSDTPPPDATSSRAIKQLSYKKLLPIVRELSITKETSRESQMIEIQNFAYKLGGEGPFKINQACQPQASTQTPEVTPQESPSYCSLLDISSEIPTNITDVAEVDLMVEQLSGFYSSKEIGLSSLTNSALYKKYKYVTERSSNGSGSSTNKTIEDLQSVFKTIFFSQSSLNEQNTFASLKLSSMLIGSSLIKAKSSQLSGTLSSGYEKVLARAPTEVKSLMEDWDNEDVEVLASNSTSSQYESQVDSPSIRVNPRKRKKVQDLRKRAMNSQSAQVSQEHSANTHEAQLEQSQAEASQLSSVSVASSQPSEPDSQQELRSSQGLSQGRLSVSQKKYQLSSQNGSQRKRKKKKGGFA